MYAKRRALAQQALLKAIDVRSDAGLELDNPLDVYDLCEKLGLRVQFVGISMEGMYKRGSPPRVLISALRPLARRVFTCAHEIGHHVFGHGSTIDELVGELAARGSLPPHEFLVQTFAGFLLMPTLGVRKAFAARGWPVAEATPAQLFTVACAFGVGYTALLNHLAYGLDMLSQARARELMRVPLPRVRRDLLGGASSAPLIVADAHWVLPTLDAEVGTQILVPPGTDVASDLLAFHGDLPSGRLFGAVRPGIARLECPGSGWAVFVRVSRYQYVGLSQYRHLEDEDEEDEPNDDG